MDDEFEDDEEMGLDGRPLTFCPECTGELDLTFASPGDLLTCSVCGSELVVVSLDPPEVDLAG